MSEQPQEAVKEMVAWLGPKLKAIRQERNLTQDELWDISDVQQGSISRLERGISEDVMLSTVFRLCAALDTDPIEILREARDSVSTPKAPEVEQDKESECLAAVAL